MSDRNSLKHVVVDGSNIATEGRSLPSLTQLNEAVLAFMEEHPGALITVVVDATFGHRIDKKEVREFEDGIANNELVAPPAGAVGRERPGALRVDTGRPIGELVHEIGRRYRGCVAGDSGEPDWGPHAPTGDGPAAIR